MYAAVGQVVAKSSSKLFYWSLELTGNPLSPSNRLVFYDSASEESYLELSCFERRTEESYKCVPLSFYHTVEQNILNKIERGYDVFGPYAFQAEEVIALTTVWLTHDADQASDLFAVAFAKTPRPKLMEAETIDENDGDIGLFLNHCIPCHALPSLAQSHPEHHAPPQFLVAKDAEEIFNNLTICKKKISDAIRSGRMPKGGTLGSDKEKMLAYIDSLPDHTDTMNPILITCTEKESDQ